MTLPAAYNQISQGQIQTEFGGGNFTYILYY
jgi:hypothetical protein